MNDRVQNSLKMRAVPPKDREPRAKKAGNALGSTYNI